MSDENENKPEKIKKPKAAKPPKVRAPRAPRPVSPFIIGTFDEAGNFTRSSIQPSKPCTMLNQIGAWVNSDECTLEAGAYDIIRLPTNGQGLPVKINIGKTVVRAAKVG